LPKDIDKSLVLDAGGGTGLGLWSIKIAKMGYNMILSDISSGMLKIAEEKIKDQNLNGKIKKDNRCLSLFFLYFSYFSYSLHDIDLRTGKYKTTWHW